MESPHGPIKRWILPSGKIELTEEIQRLETDMIKVHVKDNVGTILTYDLLLPFSIISEVYLPNAFREKRVRYIEQAKQKLNEYFIDLEKNNSINPDFEKFLKYNNATFKYDPNIQITEEAKQNSPKILTKDLEKTIIFDNEALIKIIFKIAWTHSVKQFGLAKLSNPISNAIFQYLADGHVLDSYLTKTYPELFTEPISIEGESFVFWKKGYAESGALIEKIEDKNDQNDLFNILKLNFDKFELVKQFIQFNVIPVLDDSLRLRAKEFRTHKLGFSNMLTERGQATVCHVQLFGGLLEGSVIISVSQITESLPEEKLIMF